MHLSTGTSIMLLKEFREQREYFFNSFLKPYTDQGAGNYRRKKKQANQSGESKIPPHHKKYYAKGDDIPFEVPHENQDEYLKHLDPLQWKDQDHYLVLGIGQRRYRATDDEIKKAHKKLILKYHPDKSRHKGEAVAETKDYFACITKAFEILSDPEKRRAYDSVDPIVNNMADEIPDKIDVKNNHISKVDFFAEFSPAFRWNSRWSSKQPVPQLGDQNCPEDYLDDFYDFWYNFESWRDYSYLDEPMIGEDRWERRQIEKQNREIRKERKTKDMARLRRLVDNAFNSDPRIVKFRDEEKKRRENEKLARQELLRVKMENEEMEKKKLLEIELERRKTEEEFQRVESERQKKEKDSEKKLLKKERKTLRDFLKSWDYFGEGAKNMHATERVCEALSSNQLIDLNQRLFTADPATAKMLFFEQVDILNRRDEEEKLKIQAGKEEKERFEKEKKQKEIDETWNDQELKLLIKAVNLFPAGTQSRWEVVAEYINHHCFVENGSREVRRKKTAKDIITKSKSLQQIREHHETLTSEFNKKAYDQFASTQKAVVKPAKDDNSISERENVNSDILIAKPWSPAEQKSLEMALKQFPASDGQRWEKIAGQVATRTKEECLKRYKELVDKIKAQKAAAASNSKVPVQTN